MKLKWFIICAAVLLVIAVGIVIAKEYMKSSGTRLSETEQGKENGLENGTELKTNPEPKLEPKDTERDEKPGIDESNGIPGDEWELVRAAVEEISRLKSEFNRLAFDLNHLLEGYDRGNVSGSEAVAGLENLQGGFAGLKRELAAVQASVEAAGETGAAAGNAAESFAGGAEAAATAVGFMIEYMNSGEPTDQAAFRERIRASEYFIVQGEGKLEQLKKDIL